MTKKNGHQKFWPWKWEFFPKNVIQKSRSAKLFSSSPNSALGLHHWVEGRCHWNASPRLSTAQMVCVCVCARVCVSVCAWVCRSTSTSQSFWTFEIWLWLNSTQYNWALISPFIQEVQKYIYTPRRRRYSSITEQLCAKYLPRSLREWHSNLRPSGRKASNPLLNHHALKVEGVKHELIVNNQKARNL